MTLKPPAEARSSAAEKARPNQGDNFQFLDFEVVTDESDYSGDEGALPARANW